MQLDFLQCKLSFIQSIRNASLDDIGAGLPAETLHRLCNPPQSTPEIQDPLLELTLKMLLALEHSSQDSYNQICSAIQECFPGSEVLLFNWAKTALADITGIKAMTHDMCPKSCLASETCLICGEEHFDQIKLQRSGRQVKVPCAQKMNYCEQCTQQIYEELLHNKDVVTGSAYLTAVCNGKIRCDDMLLSKLSDCWIYIWIIIEHSPDEHYKKKHVLPGTIIPGPNKLKFIAFLYPGLHHVSAIQHKGLTIWNTSMNRTFTSKLFLILACADGPGLLCLSNLIGHSGKQGCHMFCPIKGRCKPNSSQYYPILLQPLDYHVNGCLHPDIDPYNIIPSTSTPNRAQYKKCCLESGIIGPSILLGLQLEHILGIPEHKNGILVYRFMARRNRLRPH
ncbi:hypothetical protein BS17DRAFT_852819 [Gyrodon lividus]|nr:hypothetical protein BS17DRAFT_852819 [Gyrodon lividus]